MLTDARGRLAVLKYVRGGGEIKVEDDGSINSEGTGRAEQVVVLALKACLLGSFAWVRP